MPLRRCQRRCPFALGPGQFKLWAPVYVAICILLAVRLRGATSLVGLSVIALGLVHFSPLVRKLTRERMR